MEQVGGLLDKLPNLKVITLLRDPRAIFNSRKEAFSFCWKTCYIEPEDFCRTYQTMAMGAVALKAR